MAIIPQGKLPVTPFRHIADTVTDPMMLSALSIRENLDMEGTKTDSEIYAALDRLGCKDMITKVDGGLDGEGGSMSRGGKQLLALCRAVCKLLELADLSPPLMYLMPQ